MYVYIYRMDTNKPESSNVRKEFVLADLENFEKGKDILEEDSSSEEEDCTSIQLEIENLRQANHILSIENEEQDAKHQILLLEIEEMKRQYNNHQSVLIPQIQNLTAENQDLKNNKASGSTEWKGWGGVLAAMGMFFAFFLGTVCRLCFSFV